MIYEAHRSLFRYLRLRDASGWFWLKSVVLLPILESAAMVRALMWRLAGRNR
jgi:hypothetical protein